MSSAARRGAVVLAGLSIVLAAGCGASPALPGNPVDVADPHMGYQPVGTMEILATPAGAVLRYGVQGLQPSSIHPLIVAEGACGRPGATVGLLTVNSAGSAAGDMPVKLPLPASGSGGASPVWAVTIAVGPGVQAPGEALACAEIAGTGSQPLRPSSAFSSARATVHISYDRATRVMTVHVRVSGLNPGSRHPNHLHVGQCLNEGPVREVLNTLVADASGKAEATTEIPQSDGIRYGQRYVAIHHGPRLDDQGQYALLACGDVLDASTATP